eukprot:s1374_g4.t1
MLLGQPPSPVVAAWLETGIVSAVKEGGQPGPWIPPLKHGRSRGQERRSLVLGSVQLLCVEARGSFSESQEGRHVQEPWQRKALLQVQVTIAYMEQLVAYMANFAVRAAPRRGPDGRFISPGTPAHASFLLLDEDLVEKPETEVEAGAKYKGQWKGNQCHGHGTLTRPDGSSYEGSFQGGRAHGFGKFDRAQGQGKYTHEDGSTYVGQWLQDEKAGRGIERWADGSQYDGDFLQGSKHGYGVYKAANGNIVYEVFPACIHCPKLQCR